MKPKNPGYYEAMKASIQYELERNRPGSPRVNLGLMKYLSTTRGSKAIGGCIFADEISGIHLPASVVKEAQKKGMWLDFVKDAWYVTEEKINQST